MRLAPLLLERFASLVTTVVFFLGWLSVPRAVLTEPLAVPPGAQLDCCDAQYLPIAGRAFFRLLAV